jgi:Anti-sigma-K factor rskA
MSRDHARIEELTAADALGGLDADDAALLARERASHGDCPECREIEAGFAEVAGGLALSLTPSPVDDAMVDRILAASPRDRATPTAVPAPVRDELAERRASRPRIWQALAAAAVVVALAVVAVGTLAPSTTEVSGVSASQRLVAFSGTTDATLAMAYTPGEAGIVVWGRGVPDPAEGETYALWTFEGQTPVSAGCMAPVDGRMAASLPDVAATDVMAVTVESADCPAEPAGDVAFSLELA